MMAPTVYSCSRTVYVIYMVFSYRCVLIRFSFFSSLPSLQLVARALAMSKVWPPPTVRLVPHVAPASTATTPTTQRASPIRVQPARPVKAQSPVRRQRIPCVEVVRWARIRTKLQQRRASPIRVRRARLAWGQWPERRQRIPFVHLAERANFPQTLTVPRVRRTPVPVGSTLPVRRTKHRCAPRHAFRGNTKTVAVSTASLVPTRLALMRVVAQARSVRRGRTARRHKRPQVQQPVTHAPLEPILTLQERPPAKSRLPQVRQIEEYTLSCPPCMVYLYPWGGRGVWHATIEIHINDDTHRVQLQPYSVRYIHGVLIQMY